MPTPPTAAPYDAVLLLSFGGPEAPEEVVPFLENVTRGRGIPAERLAEVGEHYFLFGGRSPLNDQNRAFLEALRRDFSDAGLALPVYWGNRNWHPFLVDTVRAMRDDGIRRAAVFVTSAYSSYSSCRQYRENLADARADVVGAPRLDKLRPYFNHPGFLEPVVDAVHAALAELSQEAGRDPVLVFVTHSLPRALAESSGVEGGAYEAQHRSVMAEVCARLRHRTGRDLPSRLAFCSRSGPPQVPWLEPDVNDVLSELAAAGASGVVLAPIGFVSDHMEVVYDLDTQAAATARELALPMARAATPGLDPRFVGLVRELVLERAAAERGDAVTPAAVGSLPARPLECPDRCCAPPVGRPGTRA